MSNPFQDQFEQKKKEHQAFEARLEQLMYRDHPEIIKVRDDAKQQTLAAQEISDRTGSTDDFLTFSRLLRAQLRADVELWKQIAVLYPTEYAEYLALAQQLDRLEKLFKGDTNGLP